MSTLAELLERLQNPEPLLDLIGDALIQDIRLNFDTESDPEGNRWIPLRPGTLAKKRFNGSRLEILQETGRLLESIDKAFEQNSVIVGPDTGGTTTKTSTIAVVHQKGFTHFQSKQFVGPRPYVGISTRQINTIREIYTGYWFGS